MRYRLPTLIAPLVLVTGLFPVLGGLHPVEGQVRVTAIVVGIEAVESHDDVEWFPSGSAVARPLVVGQELGPLAQLLSLEGLAEVELACPTGDPIFLSGAFRAIVPPPGLEGPCVLYAQSGAVDVISSDTSAIRWGDAVAGSEGTHYRVLIGENPVRGPWSRLVVFEGAVRLRSASRDLEAAVGPGVGWVLSRGGTQPTEITEADIDRSASTLARVTAARSLTTLDRTATYETLLEGYRAVLANPREIDARLDLAAAGAVYTIPSSALVYHARQVQRLAPAEAARTQALYVEADLHSVRGDSATAAATRSRAVDRDSGVSVQVEDRYRRVRPATGGAHPAPGGVEAATPSGPLMMQTLLPRISAEMSATPDEVGPGEVLTLVVVARGAGGTPIEGAEVVLEAGGGEWFPGGDLSVEGRTNTRGEFRAAWSCQPCAPRYRFTAEVSRGEEQTSASVNVRIEGGW